MKFARQSAKQSEQILILKPLGGIDMIYSEKHAEELFWIKRRVLFLESLAEMNDNNFDSREAEEMGKNFKKVETPYHLVSRLKEIYGDALDD
jgi:hypothetical protein